MTPGELAAIRERAKDRSRLDIEAAPSTPKTTLQQAKKVVRDADRDRRLLLAEVDRLTQIFDSVRGALVTLMDTTGYPLDEYARGVHEERERVRALVQAIPVSLTATLRMDDGSDLAMELLYRDAVLRAFDWEGPPVE